MMNGSNAPIANPFDPIQSQQQHIGGTPQPNGYSDNSANFLSAPPPPTPPSSHYQNNGLPNGQQFSPQNAGYNSTNPYGMPQQQQQPQPAPLTESNPFGGAPSPAAMGALVVSNSQSNPYAIAPVAYHNAAPPPQQQQQHSLVQQQQQQQPWGAPGQAYSQQPHPGYGAPPPTPAGSFLSERSGSGALVPAPPRPIDNGYRAASFGDPPGQKRVSGSMEGPSLVATSGAAPAPPPSTHDAPSSPKREVPTNSNNNTKDNSSPRNKYAEELAQQAPPGASPLPKAELVRKSGYVLSRVSFRTIVMKKWKQAYWVQYGPHTMLWFRSQADFDDWLNNPYHQQSERNYLIKLAVNFVHDLYKPNVRGYQVTQCRTKAYGNKKMVRQFKLERWMDYGPTIAAAFGSYNPAEVDALREAVVECMRNTPLNNGIRATGAVRKRPEEEQQQQQQQQQQRRTEPEPIKDTPQQDATESVAEETDLLDVNNWDDVPIDTQSIGPYAATQPPNYAYAAQPQQPYAHQYHPQQPAYPPAPPMGGINNNNAMLVASSQPAQPWAVVHQPQQQQQQSAQYGNMPQQPPPAQYNNMPPQQSPQQHPAPAQYGNPWGHPPQQQQHPF